MDACTPQERNAILDAIIAARRTTRNFTPEAPPEEVVRQVVTAGLYAPYAKVAVERFKQGYFRRFFVFRRGSEALNAASVLLTQRVAEMATELETKAQADARYEEESRS